MSSDGELAHLLPVHRSYALLAAAERVDWIRQERWIQYTRAEEVLVRMGELLAYPPRDRMPALLLFGATGMGKTRIVQRFVRVLSFTSQAHYASQAAQVRGFCHRACDK
jgi:hypothetical protein